MNRKMFGIAGAVLFLLGLMLVPFMDDLRGSAQAGEAAKESPRGAPPHGASPHGGAPGMSPHGGAPHGGAVDTSKEVKFQPEKLPKTVAEVDGLKIKRETFVTIMNNVISEMQMRHQPVTEDWLKGMQARILDHLVTSEVLYAESKKAKVAVDEKALGDQFNSIKSRFKNDEDFKKNLKEQKMTADELKEDIRKNMAIMRLLDEKVMKTVSVSEDEAKKYFDSHPDEFKVPEMVRARHIVLKVEPNADEAKKAEVRKKMEEIQAKLKAGEKFEDLAKANSQDGAAVNGGDLGAFPRGAMVPEFEEAAFKMKEGEISGIVTTQFGLHLIKVEEKKPAGTSNYQDIKQDIIRGLESQYKRDKAAKYINEVKAKSKIKLNI